MSALGGLRLATVAVTLAAMQALLIDAARSGPFTHLDLPLAAVILLILLRPDEALTTGFVFGLAVDLFGTRLFGVHCLAYSILGSVAAGVPVGTLRTRTEAIACLTAAQVVVALSVTTGAVLITGGSLPPDTFGRYVQATAWTVLLVVPATSFSGTHIGLVTPDPAPLSSPPTTAEWT